MKRNDMVAALQGVFVPALRERDFKGSLPHFRRIRSDRIDLLTVQFDSHGGGFIVEVAKCDPTGLTTVWGKQIPPDRVSAWDLHPSQRHRLGSPGPGRDGRWFRFDDGTRPNTAAKAAVGYLREADRWWDPGVNC